MFDHGITRRWPKNLHETNDHRVDSNTHNCIIVNVFVRHLFQLVPWMTNRKTLHFHRFMDLCFHFVLIRTHSPQTALDSLRWTIFGLIDFLSPQFLSMFHGAVQCRSPMQLHTAQPSEWGSEWWRTFNRNYTKDSRGFTNMNLSAIVGTAHHYMLVKNGTARLKHLPYRILLRHHLCTHFISLSN